MAVKYDEATGYKLCKRGHVRSPENLNKRGECKQCRALRNSAYTQTPEYKVRRRAYQNTPEYKAKYKARFQAPEAMMQRVATQTAYRQTPSYKASRAKTRQKPNYKRWNNNAASAYREALKDSYVAKTLGGPASALPPELLELKRLHLTLKRELKKCKQP